MNDNGHSCMDSLPHLIDETGSSQICFAVTSRRLDVCFFNLQKKGVGTGFRTHNQQIYNSAPYHFT
jgi:hypothetical protein